MSEINTGQIEPKGNQSKTIVDLPHGRSLWGYEHELGFRAKLLDGKTVLDFGSGFSNIGAELKTRGINSQVVDIDLSVKGPGKDNPILGDGRNLPFVDQAFDYVLASWSTYQVPEAEKEKVYGELLRVGNTLHLAPVWKKDYELLKKLAEENNFEIVATRPHHPIKNMDKDWNDQKPFNFTSDDDYNEYMQEKSESERIIIPNIDEPRIIRLGKFTFVRRKGSASMVLRKKKDYTNTDLTS